MASLRSGRRLRPVQTWWTSVPATPAAASPIQPPRRLVTRAPARPRLLPRAISIHTVLPTGGYSGSPPPVGSFKSPILIIRGRGSPRWPQPRSWRPALGGVPNLPPPPTSRTHPWPPLVAREAWRQARYKPLIHRARGAPVAVPGLNIDVVRVRPPRRGPSPPIVRPQLGRASVMFPPPPVIGRVPTPPRRPTVVLQIDSGAGIRPILPGRPQRVRLRPIVAPRLPGRAYQAAVWTGQNSARMQTPRVIVVPRPPLRVRPTVVLQIDSGTAWQSSQRRPVIVRRPPPFRLPPRLLGPAPHHLLQSPAQHGPMTVPQVFARRYGYPSLEVAALFWRRVTPTGHSGGGGGALIVSPPQPIPPVNPPQQGQSVVPPDLVAACIAWLRLQPAIVAALGDSASSSKLTSDAEARGIAPPYLAFYEPDEDEHYETADGTGLPSSLAVGVLGLELICPQTLGKLGTRQLADAIADVLQDAPLVFLDGVLVYLRRSKRNFPVFRETGTGTNTVVWKRVITFDYMIERWAPNY